MNELLIFLLGFICALVVERKVVPALVIKIKEIAKKIAE